MSAPIEEAPYQSAKAPHESIGNKWVNRFGYTFRLVDWQRTKVKAEVKANNLPKALNSNQKDSGKEFTPLATRQLHYLSRESTSDNIKPIKKKYSLKWIKNIISNLRKRVFTANSSSLIVEHENNNQVLTSNTPPPLPMPFPKSRLLISSNSSHIALPPHETQDKAVWPSPPKTPPPLTHEEILMRQYQEIAKRPLPPIPTAKIPSLPKLNKQADKVMEEILTSEESYNANVHQLDDIFKFIQIRITEGISFTLDINKRSQQKEIRTDESIRTLTRFIETHKTLMNLSDRLIKKLKNARKVPLQIAEAYSTTDFTAFDDIEIDLKNLSRLISSNDYLRKKLDEFADAAQVQVQGQNKKKFNSLVIMHAQRIGRHELLLRELVKSLAPITDETTLLALQSAQEGVNRAASINNSNWIIDRISDGEQLKELSIEQLILIKKDYIRILNNLLSRSSHSEEEEVQIFKLQMMLMNLNDV